MRAPIWIAVYDYAGEYAFIVACYSETEAAATIFHNKYYGYDCLKISVKAWKL